jgi:hypothetical protein
MIQFRIRPLTAALVLLTPTTAYAAEPTCKIQPIAKLGNRLWPSPALNLLRSLQLARDCAHRRSRKPWPRRHRSVRSADRVRPSGERSG